MHLNLRFSHLLERDFDHLPGLLLKVFMQNAEKLIKNASFDSRIIKKLGFNQLFEQRTSNNGIVERLIHGSESTFK